MQKTAIITDSTAYLDEEMQKKLMIYTIPLSVNFADATYREGIDLTTDAFYDYLEQEEALPTTSQPAIGEFLTLLEELKEKGFTDIVSIHLSSKISGTLQTAISAGEMVDGITVFGFDSEISCSPQGFYVEAAARLALEGERGSTIIKHLKAMRKQVHAYFMVNDLNHLRRGGRLNGAQAIVGSLLQIKPILHFDEGLIMPFEKVRTEKKALSRILDMLFVDIDKGTVNEVVVIHANRLDGAERLKSAIEEKDSTIKVNISYFGPVIGTHLGAGSLGIGWY
ncbi:DegV family protein [Shouchella patagoniensis]|uniref:DegV family protein n=1 Tax=Shouchella patagoniensis TaxID=228576 RepID=UPI000994C0AD|nr:DegV family protein [Shouchella patagoniensis]